MKKATIAALILAIASLFFELLIYTLYYGYGDLILVFGAILNSAPVIILALIMLYSYDPHIFDKLKEHSKFIRLQIIATVVLTLLPIIIPGFFIDKGNALLGMIFIGANGAVWGFSLADLVNTLQKNTTFLIRKYYH